MDIKCGLYLCIQICVFVQWVSLIGGQSVSVPAPHCFNNKACPCCKVGACPSDGSGQCGDMNCVDGYHGPKCWNFCPFKCVKCIDFQGLNAVATCTQCKESYYSTATQYQCQLSCSSNCKTCESSSSRCTSCQPGYYITSSYTCDACHESCIKCSSSDLCISCKYGYYLKENTCYSCDPICSSCLSHGTCLCSYGCRSGECTEHTGSCTFGCRVNFTYSDELYRCDVCMIGLYGYDCSRTCPKNCTSECDRLTAVCTVCKPGTYGDYCENHCPPFCLSTCHKTLGQCDNCLTGYYGKNCTMECATNCRTCTMQDGRCTLCVDGFYGEDCNMNCSDHCIIRKCDRLDGRCVCTPGYEGDQCTLKITTSTAKSSTEMLVVYADSTNVVAVIGITIGVVVVLVLAVVTVVFAYRTFRRTLVDALVINLRNDSSESSDDDDWRRPVLRGIARVDMVKLRVEIATIEAALMATEQSSGDSGNDDTEGLQIRLKELHHKLPYYHSERADRSVNTYEQLQRQGKDETPYASMKAGLVTTEEMTGCSRNYDQVEPNGEMEDRLAIENTYEELQRQKANESPYASLRP